MVHVLESSHAIRVRHWGMVHRQLAFESDINPAEDSVRKA